MIVVQTEMIFNINNDASINVWMMKNVREIVVIGDDQRPVIKNRRVGL